MPMNSVDSTLLNIDQALRMNSLNALRLAIGTLPKIASPSVLSELSENLNLCSRLRLAPDFFVALAEAGADPNDTGPDGVNHSPLMVSVITESPENVAALLRLGGDPNSLLINGMDLLSLCLDAPAPLGEAMAEELLLAGARPDGPDQTRRDELLARWNDDPIGRKRVLVRMSTLPLWRAALGRRPDFIALLLRFGAEPTLDEFKARSQSLLNAKSLVYLEAVAMLESAVEKRILNAHADNPNSPAHSAYRL